MQTKESDSRIDRVMPVAIENAKIEDTATEKRRGKRLRGSLDPPS